MTGQTPLIKTSIRTMALFDCTGLYITLPWLYFILLGCTMALLHSFTLHDYTMALLHSTFLYHGSTSLY